MIDTFDAILDSYCLVTGANWKEVVKSSDFDDLCYMIADKLGCTLDYLENLDEFKEWVRGLNG